MMLRSLLLSVLGVAGAAVTWWLVRGLLPMGGWPADPGGRMAVAAAALLPSGAVLSAMILAQIGMRAASGAIDPLAGGDGRRLQVNQRVITNTIEQMACLVPSMLALAPASSTEAMPKVVALALTFAIARVVFWMGYLAGPMLRAPGMAASGAMNVAALLSAVAVWLG